MEWKEITEVKNGDSIYRVERVNGGELIVVEHKIVGGGPVRVTTQAVRVSQGGAPRLGAKESRNRGSLLHGYFRRTSAEAIDAYVDATQREDQRAANAARVARENAEQARRFQSLVLASNRSE